jgi:hypothetical protein
MKKQLIKHIYKYQKSDLNRGVKYIKKLNKYTVYINKDRKCYYIGTYLTNEEAGMAYDLKAIEIYGDDAITNYKHHKGTTIKECLEIKKKERLFKILNKINNKINIKIRKKKRYTFNLIKKVKKKTIKNNYISPDIFINMNEDEKLNYLRTGKI